MTFRGLSLDAFEDWVTEVARREPSSLGLATMFVPLFRIERIFLDEQVGAVESYRQRFERRVGLAGRGLPRARPRRGGRVPPLLSRSEGPPSAPGGPGESGSRRPPCDRILDSDTVVTVQGAYDGPASERRPGGNVWPRDPARPSPSGRRRWRARKSRRRRPRSGRSAISIKALRPAGAGPEILYGPQELYLEDDQDTARGDRRRDRVGAFERPLPAREAGRVLRTRRSRRRSGSGRSARRSGRRPASGVSVKRPPRPAAVGHLTDHLEGLDPGPGSAPGSGSAPWRWRPAP